MVYGILLPTSIFFHAPAEDSNKNRRSSGADAAQVVYSVQAPFTFVAKTSNKAGDKAWTSWIIMVYISPMYSSL